MPDSEAMDRALRASEAAFEEAFNETDGSAVGSTDAAEVERIVQRQRDEIDAAQRRVSDGSVTP